MLAWLGLLVVGFAVAAWARRRRPDAGWKPRPVPTDRISRPGRAAAIIFFVLGTLALVDPAWLIRTLSAGRAAPAAYAAFAYDEGFLRLRGPVVLGLMIAGLVILAILLREGRWRPWIRQAEMVHSVAVCIVLTWVIAAGPVFSATPTDRAVRGAASLIVLVTLLNVYTAQFGSYTTLLWQVPALGLTAQAFLLMIAMGAGSSDAARYTAAALSIIIAVASWNLMHYQRGRAINQAELAKRVSYELSLQDLLGGFQVEDGIPTRADAVRVWAVDHAMYMVWRLCMVVFVLADVAVIISTSRGDIWFNK